MHDDIDPKGLVLEHDDVASPADPASSEQPAAGKVPLTLPVAGSTEAPLRSTPRWRRLGVQFWAPVAWVCLVGAIGILAPILPIDDPNASDFGALTEGPSAQHWFGTDALGRDLFARVAYGTRVSLVVGGAATAFAFAIGGLLGLVAGFYKRRVEALVLTLADGMLAFPALVLLLALTTFMGQTQRNIVVALGIVMTPVFIRLARAHTLQFASREFVLAARATGARSSRIITREILPNVLMPLMSFSLVVVSVAIVAEGSLSFLGLSVPPTTPTWGNIIAGGRPDLEEAPHIVLIPSAVMFLTVLSFNIAGDRLREVLDVKEGLL
jgi:peptide/nickel transport system permease protein